MKILKISGWVMLIILIISQFTRPDKNNAGDVAFESFLAETKPPQEVKEILFSSCFNCHSDHTVYPWYNAITPINYWLNDNILDGKEDLNFSKWTNYSTAKKDDKLAEIMKVVEEKEMPITSYTWMHQEADLGHDQIREIIYWATQLRFEYSLKPNTQ